MNIDVVLTPAEIGTLPQRDLRGTCCVVFDVLRATSSIITALATGSQEIYPVRTIDEALALKEKMPDALLGGERHGDRIEGFDMGNSPLEYRDRVSARVITTTTNGTVALRACEGAGTVLVGALLNLGALGDYIRPLFADVLIVCAGTFADAALEDILAAGLLCSEFADATLTDSAHAAAAVSEKYRGDLYAALSLARNGRALLAKGREEEIRWCAQESVFATIGALREGVIRAVPIAM